MIKYSLVSKYTLKTYKNTSKECNNEEVPNVLGRKFEQRKLLEVLVSDLTYVRVLQRWSYVCLVLDLFNREIVGYSCGYQKTAELVDEAFGSTGYDMSQVEILHTDRGKEFDNQLIDEFLRFHGIKRSLGRKGCPYDNAVAEATYRIFKTEFCYQRTFQSLEELKLELFNYVNWYNEVRIHGSLGYLSPAEYKSVHIKTV
jgi:transposase InsO family protein